MVVTACSTNDTLNANRFLFLSKSHLSQRALMAINFKCSELPLSPTNNLRFNCVCNWRNTFDFYVCGFKHCLLTSFQWYTHSLSLSYLLTQELSSSNAIDSCLLLRKIIIIIVNEDSRGCNCRSSDSFTIK